MATKILRWWPAEKTKLVLKYAYVLVDIPYFGGSVLCIR